MSDRKLVAGPLPPLLTIIVMTAASYYLPRFLRLPALSVIQMFRQPGFTQATTVQKAIAQGSEQVPMM